MISDKISLAGDLGSGKSTVSAILVDRLGATYYSTGAIVREIAERRGMTVVELNTYMETHPEIDHEIDDGIARLSDDARMLIIDSRMAWHFTKGTFKIYLSTDIETAALRIMMNNRRGEHASTLEETISETKRRRASEKKRYMEQYGVDIKDLSNYDFILDTTYATPEEVADAIVSAFLRWQADKSYRCAKISPDRLFYPDDAEQDELVADLSRAYECGEAIPPVRVVEKDGNFYVVDGVASALAYALCFAPFVECELICAELPDQKFVRMSNSL